MKYLLEYKQSETYQGLYVTPLILDELYCRFLDMYDVDIRKSISELCKFINNKYDDILVVKMRRNIQPGLIIKGGNIQHVAKDIYDFLNKRGIDNRIVYGEGTVSHIEKDIHRCDSGQGPKGSLLIKIGRTTDALKNQKGIFKASQDRVIKESKSLSYSEMSGDEFLRYKFSGHTEDIDNRSIDYVLNFFKDDIDSKEARYYIIDRQKFSNAVIFPKHIDLTYKDLDLIIYQLEDEYFLVSTFNRDAEDEDSRIQSFGIEKYYKCDQLHGLKSLLENIKNGTL